MTFRSPNEAAGQSSRRTAFDTLNSLLGGLVDYAGLFPPAALPLEDALARYHGYLAGPHAGCLGRFIVPVARLGDVATGQAKLAADKPASNTWQLSVLAGEQPDADRRTIDAFNAAHRGRLEVGSIETKVAAPADVGARVQAFPASWEVWVEVPPAGDPDPFVAAIAGAGRSAKYRTGGITADAFPSAAQVARFLHSCHARGVRAKVTAGLHHPVTGTYPLTYEKGSASGRMFGFLNVFLAATLIRTGGDIATATELLEDAEPGSFHRRDNTVAWRSHGFHPAAIAAMRHDLLHSFGSCSFTEPIEGLASLGWL